VEIRPAGYSVGHGLAWDVGKLPLLAFGLQHEIGHADYGGSGDSIPVCVLHPDSPQVALPSAAPP